MKIGTKQVYFLMEFVKALGKYFIKTVIERLDLILMIKNMEVGYFIKLMVMYINVNL